MILSLHFNKHSVRLKKKKTFDSTHEFQFTTYTQKSEPTAPQNISANKLFELHRHCASASRFPNFPESSWPQNLEEKSLCSSRAESDTRQQLLWEFKTARDPRRGWLRLFFLSVFFSRKNRPFHRSERGRLCSGAATRASARREREKKRDESGVGRGGRRGRTQKKRREGPISVQWTHDKAAKRPSSFVLFDFRKYKWKRLRFITSRAKGWGFYFFFLLKIRPIKITEASVIFGMVLKVQVQWPLGCNVVRIGMIWMGIESIHIHFFCGADTYWYYFIINELFIDGFKR